MLTREVLFVEEEKYPFFLAALRNKLTTAQKDLFYELVDKLYLREDLLRLGIERGVLFTLPLQIKIAQALGYKSLSEMIREGKRVLKESKTPL